MQTITDHVTLCDHFATRWQEMLSITQLSIVAL